LLGERLRERFQREDKDLGYRHKFVVARIGLERDGDEEVGVVGRLRGAKPLFYN